MGSVCCHQEGGSAADVGAEGSDVHRLVDTADEFSQSRDSIEKWIGAQNNGEDEMVPAVVNPDPVGKQSAPPCNANEVSAKQDAEALRKIGRIEAVFRKVLKEEGAPQQQAPGLGSPMSPMSFASMGNVDINMTSPTSQAGVNQLRRRLEAAGIDTSKYGKGKAKPLELLYHELSVLGGCWLEDAADGGLRRVVEQVQIVVVAGVHGTDRILVSTAQVLHDNRTRNQRQLLLWKLKPKESWHAGLETALRARLQIKTDQLGKVIYTDKSSYDYREETEISKGYPGLQTNYRFHEVVVRVLDPGMEEVQSIGMPDCRGFATMEGVIGTDDVSARLNVWVWEEVSECIRQGLAVDPDKVYRSHPKLQRAGTNNGEQASQFKEFQVPIGEQLQLSKVPARHYPNAILAALTGGTRTDWSTVNRIVSSIRMPKYHLSAFHKDCLKAFPELRLYLGPPEIALQQEESTPSRRRNSVRTTSGLTSDEEYQRTFGALFAVYWLMRLDIDGKDGFCFGVKKPSWTVNKLDANQTASTSPWNQLSKDEKQVAFFRDGQWKSFEELFADAGILTQSSKKGGAFVVDAQRTKALLALTAVHDIMKVEALLPKVLTEHAPFCSYKEGEVIGDHDLALAYVMEHFPSILPSFHGLPNECKRAVLFTQSKMEFNHGWFVQAEGPPGKVLRPFKNVLSASEAGPSQKDVAFYFVHWLTDLAGAVPTPLAGAEKFVSHFPHAVLASFLQSFPVIKRLATEPEAYVNEDYLDFRWKMSDVPLPPVDSGSGAETICMQRLLCMAQHSAGAVLKAFAQLPKDCREELSLEMARTGIASQVYRACQERPFKGRKEFWTQGPAFLLYYGPALLQKSGTDAPSGVLKILHMVCQAGRVLWPLSEDLGDVTVSLRMDTLKEKPLRELVDSIKEDEVWLLVRHNDSEGFVERHSRSFIQDGAQNLYRAFKVLDLQQAI